MSYQSFEQILQKCHTEGKEFWQVILEDDRQERNVIKAGQYGAYADYLGACCWQRLLMKEILSPPADLSAVMANGWRNTHTIPVRSHYAGNM